MEEKNQEKVFFDRLLKESFGDDRTLETQRQAAAERLGLDMEDVAVRKDVLVTSLCREGVLVDLNIGRTRFMHKLSEADLGLNPENEDHRKFLAEYVRLGDKYLISSLYLKKLNNVERGARRSLEDHGFRTRWGIFIPYKNWDAVKQEGDSYRDQYFSLRDEIILNYEPIKTETGAAYRQAARESYRVLAMDKYAEAPEEFIEKFTAAVMRHFPSSGQILSSFSFNLNVGFVPLTSMIEEDRSRTELIRRRKELLEREMLAVEEKQKIALMAEYYKQNQIREIHRETLESYRRGVDSFLGDVLGQVRGMVYEACSVARNSLAKNGALTPGDSRRLQTLIQKAAALNFIDDAQVNRYLNDLRAILDTPSQERDADEVGAVLEDICAENRQVLMLLGCEPRSARSAGLEGEIEITPAAPLRRARQIKFPVEKPGTAQPLERIKRAI